MDNITNTDLILIAVGVVSVIVLAAYFYIKSKRTNSQAPLIVAHTGTGTLSCMPTMVVGSSTGVSAANTYALVGTSSGLSTTPINNASTSAYWNVVAYTNGQCTIQNKSLGTYLAPSGSSIILTSKPYYFMMGTQSYGFNLTDSDGSNAHNIVVNSDGSMISWSGFGYPANKNGGFGSLFTFTQPR